MLGVGLNRRREAQELDLDYSVAGLNRGQDGLALGQGARLMTGIVIAKVSQNLSRNIATE